MVHKYLHALILDNGKTSTAGGLSVFFTVAPQPAPVASLCIPAAASSDAASVPHRREETSLYLFKLQRYSRFTIICFGA